MTTKECPGDFDCYRNAHGDEHMFILLGRDKHAPQLVELWARIRDESGEDPEQVNDARKCANDMRKYRYAKRGAPTCEYGDNCMSVATHIVTDDNIVHFPWCGDFRSCPLASETAVTPIDEYMTAEFVPVERGT